MKIGKYILIGIAVITLFFIIGRMGWYETHTIRYGNITKVENDRVIFEDSDGYTWYFYGDGYQINDPVEVTFWNGATETIIEDDEIETVKILQK